MRKSLIIAAVVALVCASTAFAGGWATVKLNSSPKGLTADEPWVVDITVLQHGETPLAGVTPIVRIRDSGGNVVKSFTATPTGTTGVYHAEVTFPGEGTYSYEVDDGFGTYGGAQTHTFRPVAIGAGDGGFPYEWLAVALGLAAALAAATVLTLRRRGPSPQPVQLKEAA